MARPTKFTAALGTKICERIAEGESLRAITREDKMPSATTVFNWLLDPNKKEFLEQYNKAKSIQAEMMAEDLIEIADNSEFDELERTNGNGDTYYVANTEYIQRSKLRVDTRKFVISKLLPKKYGEKSSVDVTTNGKDLPSNGITFVNFNEPGGE